jgi:hypothetical protein
VEVEQARDVDPAVVGEAVDEAPTVEAAPIEEQEHGWRGNENS